MNIYNTLVFYHELSVYFLVFMLVVYLFLSQSKAKAFSYIKKIKLFLPIFYMVFACVMLTGLNLLAMREFALNPRILIMLFTWILMLYGFIKLYKSFKANIRSKSISRFSKLALLVLGVFLVVCVLQIVV